MRLDGCVRRDDMEIRGISCMLYVHKHWDTSPKTMSPDAYSMLMRVFMGSMTPRGSADLRTSIHISLTREDPGGVRAPQRFTLAHVDRVQGSTTHPRQSKIGGHPQRIEIGPKSMSACFCINMTSVVGSLTKYSLKYSGGVPYHFSGKGKTPMYG